MKELTEWGNFYLIVGAGAGALIGLQFVVLTLIAERPPLRAREAGAAFSTPTILHLTVTLLLAGLLQVPWPTIVPVSILWGCTGLFGIIYVFIVVFRMRRQKVYKPVFYDWIFHFFLPFTAYALLMGATIVALNYQGIALLIVGGAVLLLLLVGIHNAWDAVTYHVFSNKEIKNKYKHH